MLVQLGQRAATSDVVDLLYECHGRIRKFLSFATKLATTSSVSDAEAKDVASQIYRYFTISFPLHLADEDESIAPALANTPSAAALARMHADHVEHEPLVRQIVALCSAIEREPASLERHRPALREAAARLSSALEPHLELEERDIFPALRRLPGATRDALLAAMRARREAVL